MRTTIVTQVAIPSVITEPQVGPQGPTGISGSDVVLTSRLDMTHKPILYAGEAAPGSAESAAVWRIWRVNTSVGATKEWANGAATFINKWTERTTLNYS